MKTETPFGEYAPKLMDTSGVTLPPELLEVKEQIAEQVHDAWAIGRLEDGWSYGPARDDEAKETPALVPYDHLSEREQAFDSVTAEQTLKFLLAMGWKLSPPS